MNFHSGKSWLWFGSSMKFYWNLMHSVHEFVVWIWLSVLGGQQWIYELCWFKPWWNWRLVFYGLIFYFLFILGKLEWFFFSLAGFIFYCDFPFPFFYLFILLASEPWNKFLRLLHLAVSMKVYFCFECPHQLLRRLVTFLKIWLSYVPFVGTWIWMCLGYHLFT